MSQYIDLKSGKFHYSISGAGDAILVLHGGSESSESMSPIISILEKKFKVYALDFRGHGKSYSFNGPFSYDDHMADVEDFVTKLNIAFFSLVGFSDGAIVGVGLAIKKHPKLVKLISISANVFPAGVRKDVIKWLHDNDANKSVENKFAPAYEKNTGSKKGFAEYWKQLKTLWLTEPQWKLSALEKINIPVLYVSADNDTIELSHSVDLLHHTPNSQLLVMPNTKHDISTMPTGVIGPVFLNFL